MNRVCMSAGIQPPGFANIQMQSRRGRSHLCRSTSSRSVAPARGAHEQQLRERRNGKGERANAENGAGWKAWSGCQVAPSNAIPITSKVPIVYCKSDDRCTSGRWPLYRSGRY